MPQKTETKSREEAAHMSCVYNPKKKCPVRAEMKKTLSDRKTIDKIIKPVADSEMMKMFLPILEHMKETMMSEFGLLHNYCAVCPHV